MNKKPNAFEIRKDEQFGFPGQLITAVMNFKKVSGTAVRPRQLGNHRGNKTPYYHLNRFYSLLYISC